jgi:excisionase family DNA binding protein
MSKQTTGAAPKPGTLKHAAAIIGVSLPTLYELIRADKLRTYKVGRAHRVTDEAIAECITRLEAEKRAEGASIQLRMRLERVDSEYRLVHEGTGNVMVRGGTDSIIQWVEGNGQRRKPVKALRAALRELETSSVEEPA